MLLKTATDKRTHIGIKGIKSRAQALNGTAEITIEKKKRHRSKT